MAFLFAISLILAFKVLLLSCANHESVYSINGPFSSEINPNLARRSNWAFNYIANISCEDVFLISREDCLKFKTTLPQNMNLYYAEPSTEIRYRIALPDGYISKSGSHDGVLVIDPFSKANFGHLVLVFFIDVSWTKIQCELNGGIYMGECHCHLNFVLFLKVFISHLT